MGSLPGKPSPMCLPLGSAQKVICYYPVLQWYGKSDWITKQILAAICLQSARKGFLFISFFISVCRTRPLSVEQAQLLRSSREALLWSEYVAQQSETWISVFTSYESSLRPFDSMTWCICTLRTFGAKVEFTDTVSFRYMLRKFCVKAILISVDMECLCRNCCFMTLCNTLN